MSAIELALISLDPRFLLFPIIRLFKEVPDFRSEQAEESEDQQNAGDDDTAAYDPVVAFREGSFVRFFKLGDSGLNACRLRNISCVIGNHGNSYQDDQSDKASFGVFWIGQDLHYAEDYHCGDSQNGKGDSAFDPEVEDGGAVIELVRVRRIHHL